jgi:RNA polymerase sigma-70 factor (ECF subfamily)
MGECIGSFGGLVWGIVQRRVREHAAAEDVVQEIFIDIWRHAGRYDPLIASETAFVAMIARRKVIDWLRKQARQPQMMPLEEMAEPPAAPSASAAGMGMDREMILEIIAELPEETRNLFRLHFELGLTHGEIAEKTGLPLGSVKTRLRRGLLEARTLVARLGESVNPSLGEPA